MSEYIEKLRAAEGYIDGWGPTRQVPLSTAEQILSEVLERVNPIEAPSRAVVYATTLPEELRAVARQVNSGRSFVANEVVREAADVIEQQGAALRRALEQLESERRKVEGLRGELNAQVDGRKWARRCVGSLPLEIGEQFDRTMDRLDASAAALQEDS